MSDDQSIDSLFAEPLAVDPAGVGAALPPWRILVVDDDHSVHEASAFALDGFTFEDRSITLVSVYRGDEALKLLREDSDFAVALIDVVMETDHAGLDLVTAIRETLGLQQLRIILRTGQPGVAPEMDVIRRYDINDYRGKAELTAQRLQSSVVNALRTFAYIETIEEGRRGLRKIIEASAQLMQRRGLQELGAGVITHLAALIGSRPEGLLALVHDGDEPVGALEVIAAAGRLEQFIGRNLAALSDFKPREALDQALRTRRNVVEQNALALYVAMSEAAGVIVYAESDEPLGRIDFDLLELFAGNTGISLENARLFERTRFLAFNDPLTGLLNRVGFREEMQALIASDTPFTLIVADADGFQEFNDGLGHAVGDNLLLGLADRLRKCLPPESVLARDHSDNFSILLRTDDEAEVARIVHDLLRAMKAPLPVRDDMLPVSITLGSASFPLHGRRGRELHARAGTAMAAAKKRVRGGWLPFDAKFEEQLARRIMISRGLRTALETEAFALAYQPQFALDGTGRGIGAEALLRWPQPDGRTISPAEFIPLAETAGLIRPIGGWVMTRALNQLREWRGAGLDVQMAVNVSMDHLLAPDFPTQLGGLCEALELPPGVVEVEITETLAATDIAQAVRIIATLRDLGHAVALDDFGTGYSSLSYLQQLPVSILKLDRSLVCTLEEGQRSVDFAAAVVRMAKVLGMRVIAEGVETQAQNDLLIQIGADIAQGYFYARPQPATEAAALLRQGVRA